MRGPTGDGRRSRSASVSTSTSSSRDPGRDEGCVRAKPLCASGPVDRSEDARIGKGERIRRSIGSFDESESMRRELVKRRGRCTGEVGVDDEHVALGHRKPRLHSRAETISRIVDNLRPRRDDRAIVGHDENPANFDGSCDHVPEHGDGCGSTYRRRQPSLRVAAVRDHDRRHAPKRTQVPWRRRGGARK